MLLRDWRWPAETSGGARVAVLSAARSAFYPDLDDSVRQAIARGPSTSAASPRSR